MRLERAGKNLGGIEGGGLESKGFIFPKKSPKSQWDV
jgi:hypothetical protein